MPSGFQQDANQLAPGFYRVTLTLSGGTATWPTDGTLLTSGAFNPSDWDAFTTKPTTVAKSNSLARGNMRWQAMIEEVSKHADAQIIDVEITGSTVGDDQATQIQFTVRYDRDAGLLNSYQKVMLSEDATNTTFVGYGGGGNIVDTTVKAVREMVARAAIRGGSTGYSRSYRVYAPASGEGMQLSVSIKQPDTSSKVWADVAVVLLDGTELTTLV